MKQTYLPEHFPQVKQDLELSTLKRKPKDLDFSLKTPKIDEIQSKQGKFNIPPSKVNNLSFETLTILNSLNLTYQNRAAKSSEDVLSSVSAREKYQDLLDPMRKLPLPYKYKRLLKLQEYLDTTINNASIRKLPTAYLNIKQAIENTYSITFDLEQLQRILFLCPHFYTLSWEVEDGEEKLKISIPESTSFTLSSIHNRNNELFKQLISLTKRYHNSHLASIIPKIHFDPEIAMTWHSSFALHDVPDVFIAELPDKNLTESPTVAKISVAKQLRVIRLTQLCHILVKIFASHKTPSIFLKSLIKKIEIEKGKNEEPKLLENDVVELCEIFNTWIGIIKTGSGDVVRICKQTDFSLKIAAKKIKQKYN
ncbi:hypothetical protein SteCoe_20616 [Stentor coeruleus]|uniref:CDT1 Geminin-binding domain-containing protein n=1 Tax=Stentor coeruleus TaxID=5963 RepID=A0A1R2BRQ1_9CILI|nr:hypothetical protein SteCoe_20616 [Stentor coeruleus]